MRACLWRLRVLPAAVLGVLGAPLPAAAAPAPAYPGDAPDPFVLEADGVWYTFTTQVRGVDGGWVNVPVLRSDDGLTGWAPASVPDALPQLPAWARSGNTWAPAVARTGPSRFVLYYTVTDGDSGLQCISRAVSSHAAGPYEDRSSRPFVCQEARGGSIDPHPFRGPDGILYLHWKSDDNRIGKPATIWAGQLSADGLSFERRSRAYPLLQSGAAWEGGIIEGPAMTAVALPTRSGGRPAGYRYFLMYGGNAYASPAAGIGWAVCAGPLGPCLKMTPFSPWMSTAPGGSGPVGPAGPSFYVLGASDPFAASQQLAYHGWICPPGTVCDRPTGYGGGAVRALWIDTVRFSTGPTREPV